MRICCNFHFMGKKYRKMSFPQFHHSFIPPFNNNKKTAVKLLHREEEVVQLPSV